MKGDNEVLRALNLSLKDQLTMINQTFLHARMARDWGLGKFDEHEYKHSIQAMKQADAVIERILFLDGLPNLQDLGKLMIGENIPEMIQGDLDMYMSLRSNLLDGMRLSEERKDYITRDLFEDVLEDVEETIDWYETQQWLVGNTGLENYLQTLAGGA
jgi:bacterioferritin